MQVGVLIGFELCRTNIAGTYSELADTYSEWAFAVAIQDSAHGTFALFAAHGQYWQYNPITSPLISSLCRDRSVSDKRTAVLSQSCELQFLSRRNLLKILLIFARQPINPSVDDNKSLRGVRGIVIEDWWRKRRFIRHTGEISVIQILYIHQCIGQLVILRLEHGQFNNILYNILST